MPPLVVHRLVLKKYTVLHDQLKQRWMGFTVSLHKSTVQLCCRLSLRTVKPLYRKGRLELPRVCRRFMSFISWVLPLRLCFPIVKSVSAVVVSHAEAGNVEAVTRSQGNCKEWFRFRAGRMTASRFKDAVGTESSQAFSLSHLIDVLSEKSPVLKCRHMRHIS